MISGICVRAGDSRPTWDEDMPKTSGIFCCQWYFWILDSDGQPESQRRVVEVWIVDTSAEAVRSLSYQQGWMQPFMKSATLVWSKRIQLEGFISLNSGKPGTPPKRIHPTSNFKNGQVPTLIQKESAWLGIRAWLTALCHPQRPQLDKKTLHVAT